MAASPILRVVGRGDRHPVLILPGFTADDRSTVPLRWFLRGQGYWVHGWLLGNNFGPTRRVVRGLEDRLLELHERHGQKVTVIGWSLGGIYARMLARRHPEAVRQVITLGSPFRMAEGDHSNAEGLWKLVEPTHSKPDLEEIYLPEDEQPPLQVPATSIYTRTDGVVKWFTCIDRAGERRENIEVRGSHSGLGWNPAVLVALADRLAQPEGEWRPFKRRCSTAHLFPRADTYRAA
jgi:pimeloyl-ACP methyl ester carboxylesterase